MESKRCTRCGQTKPLPEFSKHRGTKDDLDYWCKHCCRERYRKYRKTPSGIYTGIKALQNYHKRKPVTITREEFIKWHGEQTKQCAYCDLLEEDIKLMHDYYRSESRLTIDCMDNDTGYVLGNIVLSCGRCNFLKSNLLDYDEMRHYAQTYIKPKWVALKTKGRKHEGSILPQVWTSKIPHPPSRRHHERNHMPVW